MDKHSKLRTLAKIRQTTRWEGYKRIGDYQRGAYECQYVSPFTKSAGNVDAEVFVLLQDWSSDDSLRLGLDDETVTLGHTPSLATNRNLMRLLRSAFGLTLADTYATNLFPFIKLGPMNAPIPQRDLIRAAREFALPQIQIVRPKIVICLGLVTFKAMQRACGLPTSQKMDIAIRSPFKYDSVSIWCQAHTGGLGQNTRNRGGVDRVTSDWQEMKRAVSLPTRKSSQNRLTKR